MGTKLSRSQFAIDTADWYQEAPDGDTTEKDIQIQEQELLDSLDYPVLCATISEADAELLCAGYCAENFKQSIIPNVIFEQIKAFHSSHRVTWKIPKSMLQLFSGQDDIELIAPSFKIDFDNIIFSYFLMRVNDDPSYRTVGIEPEVATVNAVAFACRIRLICVELGIEFHHIHLMGGKPTCGGEEVVANQYKFPKDHINVAQINKEVAGDKLTIGVEMELLAIRIEEDKDLVKFRQYRPGEKLENTY